jgi:hypothetical protein
LGRGYVHQSGIHQFADHPSNFGIGHAEGSRQLPDSRSWADHRNQPPFFNRERDATEAFWGGRSQMNRGIEIGYSFG